MFENETIPDSPLFAGIQPEEKESILKCLSAVEKKYEKGDAVFLAGTEIHSMGFVRAVSRSPEMISGETVRSLDMRGAGNSSVRPMPACRGKL